MVGRSAAVRIGERSGMEARTYDRRASGINRKKRKEKRVWRKSDSHKARYIFSGLAFFSSFSGSGVLGRGREKEKGDVVCWKFCRLKGG